MAYTRNVQVGPPGLLAAGLLLECLRSKHHRDRGAEPPERERIA